MMNILIHVRIKKMHQIFTCTARLLPANKSIRDENSFKMSICKPIDRKRNIGIFQFLLYPLWNDIFFLLRHSHTSSTKRGANESYSKKINAPLKKIASNV